MATNGMKGFGTELGYADSLAGPWTVFAGVGDITGGDSTVSRHAFATMDQSDINKQAVFGLADTSDLTFEILYKQDRRAELEGLKGVPKYFRIRFLGADGLVGTWHGAVTKVGQNVPMETAIMCPTGIGFDGGITWTQAAGSRVKTMFSQAMVGGVATVDLTNCGPGGGLDLTGKKVTRLVAGAASGNGAAITVAKGGTNGYAVTTNFTTTLAAGEQTTVDATSAAPAVGSGAKTLDVSGTGTDVALFEITAQ